MNILIREYKNKIFSSKSGKFNFKVLNKERVMLGSFFKQLPWTKKKKKKNSNFVTIFNQSADGFESQSLFKVLNQDYSFGAISVFKELFLLLNAK